MTDGHSKSTSHSSGWQPSTLDASSPTYSGHAPRAGTGANRATQRPWSSRIVIALLAVGGLAAITSVVIRTAPAPVAMSRPPVAITEVVRGSVTMIAADRAESTTESIAVQRGATLAAGTVLSTEGGSGLAAFRLTGGQSVRLAAGSRVRLASSSALVLERGAVYVDSADGPTVEVRTAFGLVRDIGTQFEVRLMEKQNEDEGESEGTLRVRVREGAVVLEQTGERHQATAGVELRTQADGTVERGLHPVHGEAWDWILDTAPMPDLEGRSLLTFLEFAAHEGGWRLKFASTDVAQLASSIILHGQLDGLNAKEATAVVFESSDLDYRIEDGIFHVRRKASGPTGLWQNPEPWAQ